MYWCFHECPSIPEIRYMYFPELSRLVPSHPTRPSLHLHDPTIQFLTACSMQKWKKALYVYYMSGINVLWASPVPSTVLA